MTADPEVGVDDRAAPWRGEHDQPEPPELHGAVADEPTRRRHSHVGGGHIAFHAGVAAATVVVIRILGDGWSGGFPITFPDSSSYLKVAGIGPLWPSFWFDERPIGFPLFTWMFGRSERFTVFAQTVVYVAAFSALIVAVWRSLQSRVARVVALVFVAGVATQPRFAMWNPLMLSESLSLSLGVGSLAGWWSFAAVPGRRRAVIAGIVTVCWLVVRDSNLIIVVGFVVPTVLLTWRFGHGIPASVRRVLVPIAACLLAVGGYLFVAQSVTERNVYAVYNNVGMRVLPDEDMTEWWVDHGMPINDTLRGRTGKNSWDDGSAFLTDPELTEFRAWAEGPGQRVQVLSTFVEFDFWFDKFRDDLPTLLAEPFARVRQLPGRRPAPGVMVRPDRTTITGGPGLVVTDRCFWGGGGAHQAVDATAGCVGHRRARSNSHRVLHRPRRRPDGDRPSFRRTDLPFHTSRCCSVPCWPSSTSPRSARLGRPVPPNPPVSTVRLSRRRPCQPSNRATSLLGRRKFTPRR